MLLAVTRGTAGTTLEIPQVRTFLQRFGEPGIDTSDRLIDLVERCLAAEQQIDANVSIPLCLEALFDDLGKLLRTV